VKLIAWCVALLAIVAGCCGAHPVAKPTPPTSRATHVATSDAPTTAAATVASEQRTCSRSKPHNTGHTVDIRPLRNPLKLSDGQFLLYPIRDHDRPTVDPAAALHPHDGAGNSFNPVYDGATSVLLLVRFTDVISIPNPNHWVDRLAWVAISNCVLLTSHGPGTAPPFTGYSMTVVDAIAGVALINVQGAPPLTVAQIGS
jgi:hypothetical protein